MLNLKLLDAIESNDLDKFKLLIDKGADIHVREDLYVLLSIKNNDFSRLKLI